MSSEGDVVKPAVEADLKWIVPCHLAAFPKTLSSRMGLKVSWRTLQWYVCDAKRFMLWINREGKCVGYVGGMICDGMQVHGSASSMIQHAFKASIFALIIRPWLWFHPELRSRYRLIAKNLYFKIIGYKKPMRDRKNHKPSEPYVGLVVIGVHPEHQGKGYGSQLLKAFEQKASELGYSRMTLSVLPNNSQAITAYKQNGWFLCKENRKSLTMEKKLG